MITSAQGNSSVKANRRCIVRSPLTATGFVALSVIVASQPSPHQTTLSSPADGDTVSPAITAHFHRLVKATPAVEIPAHYYRQGSSTTTLTSALSAQLVSPGEVPGRHH
jgi:hypothetical protein